MIGNWKEMKKVLDEARYTKCTLKTEQRKHGETDRRKWHCFFVVHNFDAHYYFHPSVV